MKLTKNFLLETLSDRDWLKVDDNVLFRQNLHSPYEDATVTSITLLLNPKDTQSTEGLDTEKVMWYDKDRIIVEIQIKKPSGEITDKWAYGEQIYPIKK